MKMKQHLALWAVMAVAGTATNAMADEITALGTPGKDPGKCVPSLRIHKRAERPDLGGVQVPSKFRIYYEIELENTGTCDLYDIKLVDYLPKGLKVEESDPEPTNDSGRDGKKVIWEGIDLAPGESETFEIEAKLYKLVRRYLVNKACASHPFLSRPVCDKVTTVLPALPREGSDLELEE